MLDKKMLDALNKQMNAELYSWYLYLAMATYFESELLQGCANWMKIQAKEEMGHAMKFFDFIGERGARADLAKIDAPKAQWKTVLEVFTETLEHEKKVTAGIHKLVDLALELKDHATNNFLKWFVDEQVEEESTAELIVHQLKMAGTDGRGLFLVDRELGKREAS